MKRIAILGCGWLGFPLAKTLVEKGWTIHGSTRSAEKLERLKASKIKAFQINFDAPDIASRLPHFLQVDQVFVNVPPGRRRPNVLDWYPEIARKILRASNPEQVERIIWVSSTGVYGNLEGKVDESMTPEPQTNNQKALLAAEQAIQQATAFNHLILRPAGLVGGQRHPGRWLAGKTGLNNGTDVVNLIHQADLIQICIALIEGEVNNTVFNICADEHPKKSAYYPTMAQKMGLEPPQYDLPEGDTETATFTGKWIDNAKIKAALNYQFQFPDPYDFS
ncbi:MAG: SDR family oxidoreductase [Bacteroidota bacterium]